MSDVHRAYHISAPDVGVVYLYNTRVQEVTRLDARRTEEQFFPLGAAWPRNRSHEDVVKKLVEVYCYSLSLMRFFGDAPTPGEIETDFVEFKHKFYDLPDGRRILVAGDEFRVGVYKDGALLGWQECPDWSARFPNFEGKDRWKGWYTANLPSQEEVEEWLA